MKYGTPGSISSGTMREEDLIPCFVGVLQELDCCNEIVEAISTTMNEEDYYDKTENANYDLDILCNELENHAPPGYYFGANEGDGADYGFWKIEE